MEIKLWWCIHYVYLSASGIVDIFGLYSQNHNGLSAKTAENEADIIVAICLKNRSGGGGEGKFPDITF